VQQRAVVFHEAKHLEPCAREGPGQSVGTAAGGSEMFAVSDADTLSLATLAALIAELGHARPPRRIPDLVADTIAPVGDLVSRVVGREFPLTSARLRALREVSEFPSDPLVAAGFVHPQSTRDGIGEMLDWLRRQG
jgi:hypothetical protein